MAYEPFEWIDGETAITAERLNRMESGIASTGTIPIFATLAEAQEYEQSTGAVALTIESPVDTTPPEWVAVLIVTTPDGGTASVSASALATDNVGVAGYEFSLDAGTTWHVAARDGGTFTLSGLESETTYTEAFIRAIDPSGNSRALAIPTFTTPASLPPAPTDMVYQWLGSSLPDGPVTVWADEINDFSVDTKPEGGINAESGVVSFSSVSRGLVSSNTLTTPISANSTVAATVKVDSQFIEPVSFVLAGGSDGLNKPDTYGCAVPSGGTKMAGIWGEVQGHNSSQPSADSEWRTIVFRASGAQSSVFYNGQKYTLVTNPQNGEIDGVVHIGSFGSSWSFRGDMREIRVYNRVLTDTETEAVAALLNTQYGV